MQSPDDVLPYPPSAAMAAKLVNNGTYVIRKGRKQRQRIPDMDNSLSSISSKLSNAEMAAAPLPIFPSSIFVPNTRHSIDLGASHAQATVNQLLSSRTIHVPFPNSSAGGMIKSNNARAAAMHSPRYVEMGIRRDLNVCTAAAAEARFNN